jgi:hypothetical protein
MREQWIFKRYKACQTDRDVRLLNFIHRKAAANTIIMCQFTVNEKICDKCCAVRSSVTRLEANCSEIFQGKPCNSRNEVKNYTSRGACMACFQVYVSRRVVEQDAEYQPSNVHSRNKA